MNKNTNQPKITENQEQDQIMMTIKITYNNVTVENKKAYTIDVHHKQLKKMMRKYPNKLYRQTIEYYSGDGEKLTNKDFNYIEYSNMSYNVEGQPTYEESNKIIKFNNFQWVGRAKDLTKEEIKRIELEVSDKGGLDCLWNVIMFFQCRNSIDDNKAYVNINTYII
jgi:hypothetical protein